jgi:hypothetical protein
LITDKKVFLEAWSNLADLLIGHTQLVVEMLASRHFSDPTRWRIVLVVEIIK